MARQAVEAELDGVENRLRNTSYDIASLGGDLNAENHDEAVTAVRAASAVTGSRASWRMRACADALQRMGLRRAPEIQGRPNPTRMGRRAAERDSCIEHLATGERGGTAAECAGVEVAPWAEIAAHSDHSVVWVKSRWRSARSTPTTARHSHTRVRTLPLPDWSRVDLREVGEAPERRGREGGHPTERDMHTFDSLAQELAAVVPNLPRRAGRCLGNGCSRELPLKM